MLQAQQSANYNSINGKGNNNGFSAHPRVVAQKSKYKDPYGATDTEEYVP